MSLIPSYTNNKFFKKISVLLFAICICTCVYVLGESAQSRTFQTVAFQNIEYVGVPVTTENYVKEITGPISLKQIKHPLDLNSLNLSFSFMTQEPTFSYGNLFQTGDTPDAIRMELQPSSNLVLVLGNRKIFHLSDDIHLGKYHQVQLNYEREESLKVLIDGEEVLNLPDNGSLVDRSDLSNILVGAGLGGQRTLLGSVSNFNLDCAYSHSDLLAKLSKWLLIILCGFSFIWSLPITSIVNRIKMRGVSTTTSTFFDSTSMYGVTLSFFAVGFFFIYLLGEQYLGLTKWIVHLTVPVSLVSIIFLLNLRKNVWTWAKWPLGLTFFAYTIYNLILTSYKQNAYDTAILGVVVFSLLAVCIILYKTKLSKQSVGKADTLHPWKIVAIFSSIFLAVSWSTVVELTNWQVFRQALDSSFGLSIVGVFLVLRVVFSVTFEAGTLRNSYSNKSYIVGSAKNLISRFYLEILIVLIFFFMSFRHDSLFISGATYHWEYYIGVIQGINNGGWLLWDTPSQYGFLNILLASLIPSVSAWQSFYLFQGVLLFIVSTSIYFAGRPYIASSVFQRLALFTVLFMALFFADPHFIGPYPFPSSSVVRFFCVYALVLVVWFIPKFGLRQASALAVILPISIIWSAESAIYAIATFLFIIFALLLTREKLNNRFILIGQYALIAGASLSFVIATISAFYYLKLGVLPDFVGYYEHAIGYAGGHGYVPFPITGPGNLLFLIFMAISILCISVMRDRRYATDDLVAPLAAMAGCIWGIATYYIGRPVPQNITAILPIIFVVVYLALILSSRIRQGGHSLPIKIVSIPVIFLLLTPLFNLNWIETIIKIEVFSANVTTKLPTASNELQQLLSQAEIPADMPIVYYGDDATPPIFTGDYSNLNESNWLPIPLQLLEQPVSHDRRKLYLNRFICRNQQREGILINRKSGSIEPRLQGFLSELGRYYDVKDVLSGSVYKLYRFSRLNLQDCMPVVGKKTS
jgi:hypothetical protein